MTLILTLFATMVVLAALGALARTVGADTRDQIDDTHGRRPVSESI